MPIDGIARNLNPGLIRLFRNQAGNCDCPDYRAQDGSRCGGRASEIRPRGRVAGRDFVCPTLPALETVLEPGDSVGSDGLAFFPLRISWRVFDFFDLEADFTVPSESPSDFSAAQTQQHSFHRSGSKWYWWEDSLTGPPILLGTRYGKTAAPRPGELRLTEEAVSFGYSDAFVSSL